MKKLILIFGLMILGCSKSDSPAPVVNTCTSELATGLALSATFAYTADTYAITGTKFCKEDLVSVLVNDQEITIADISATKITFLVPSITGDSATVKIKTKTATTAVKGKFAVYPGGGTWKEVAAFPAQGRYYSQQVAVGGVAYVSSGNNYTGATASGTIINYNYTYFGDIYKYDATQNAWTLLVTNDNVKNKGGITALGSKLFLFPTTGSGNVTTYDINGGTFGTTGNYVGGTSISYAPFSIGGNAYNCIIERSSTNIIATLIRKYNSGTNQWDLVTTNAAGDGSLINFVFERQNKIYIGINQLNSKDVQFYSFDPATNQFTTLVKASLPSAASDLQVLRHLFTINNLAYFIEVGSSSLSQTSVSILAPGAKLHMYNFKDNTFRSVAHTYPESFHRPASFTLNNRGFAGMGLSASGALFVYPAKFYEFVPK